MSNPTDFHHPYELIGASAAVRDCVVQVEGAAADDRGVLLVAERGLDAESVARAVHEGSRRRSQPFVVVRAGGAPAELERELFGAQHRSSSAELEMISPRSAIYGAQGGVLFLANIGELPVPLQRRLARLLRDGEARVPRRAAPIPVDVRVMAAAETVTIGDIREDLARRLPLVVNVPALRQRRGDVPAIAEAMLAARGADHRFTPAALTVLAALPWRRNTAELAGLIERLSSGGAADVIRQEDVLAEVQLDPTPARPRGSLRDARRQFEREYIAAVLRAHEWQMREAARALGIERANLYRKARQLGIPLRGDSSPAATRAAR